MYSYIDGKLVQLDPATAVIDVGGIGYQLRISLNTYSGIKVGERCKLSSYLYIKEDQHTLFGFKDVSEKEVFLKLIGISGVGPSTGLMVLSSMTVPEIIDAITNGDTKAIERVKGIGKKTAQRIVLELKDKMNVQPTEEGVHSDTGGTPAVLPDSITSRKNEALQGLVALGLSKNIGEKMIDAVVKKHGTQVSVEELIKLSLQNK